MMNVRAKIKLYRKVKYYILQGNTIMAKKLLTIIRYNANSQMEKYLLQDLIEISPIATGTSYYKKFMILKLNTIIKNKKNYPKLTAWIIP